jgi:tripartite-type tricarboxylate transporter receptor subunit TctC
MHFAKVTRRAAIIGVAAMTALPAIAADTWPSKPIKIILGFGPGGTTDSIARLYGQKMSELLKTPVIVDNKPGGNQMNAINSVRMAPPDGYTLYAATGSALVQNPAVRKDLPYDPLKDFSLIGVMATNPAVIFINTEVPVKTVAELIAYNKANPGKLNYGSAGVGTAGHLAGEAFMHVTGMKMTHVPYKSDVDVIRETIAGNVHFGISTTVNTVSFVKSGKIRALAVTTAKRLPYLPDVPSLPETGVQGISELEPHTFISLVGPAGLPPAIVTKLNETLNKISADPDIASKVRDTLYSEPATMTPASFRDFIEKELAKWRVVGKTVKLD